MKSQLDLNFYIRYWNLEETRLVTTTHTSEVFQVIRGGERFILKILNEKGVQCELSSQEVLTTFDGAGMVQIVDSKDRGLLLEYIDGEKLSQLSKNGRDREAAYVISDLVNQMSEKETCHVKLHGIERQFLSLFQRAKESTNSQCLYFKTAKIAQELVDTERKVQLLHGDIHHDNILHSSKRGWLLVDPQAFYGERTYDLCNSFYNPDDFPDLVETKERIENLAELYAEKLRFDRLRILKFAYAFGGLSLSLIHI